MEVEVKVSSEASTTRKLLHDVSNRSPPKGRQRLTGSPFSCDRPPRPRLLEPLQNPASFLPRRRLEILKRVNDFPPPPSADPGRAEPRGRRRISLVSALRCGIRTRRILNFRD